MLRRGAYGRVVSVGILLIGVSGLPGLSVSSARAADVSAGVSVSSAAPPTASEQAAASGQPVELVERRSETGQVFANPDGTFTREISAVPVRVRRGSGWAGIDTTLERRGDGSVVPKAVAFDVAFSGGGSQPLVSLHEEGADLDVGAPFALPVPVLTGSTATYSDVQPGVDLVLTAEPDSFSQVFVVKSPQALASPALASLGFPLSSRGLTVRRGDGRAVEAVDSFGNVVFDAANPVMWDSAGSRPAVSVGAVGRRAADLTAEPEEGGGTGAVRGAGGGPVEGDAVETVPVTVSESSLVLKPDSGFLADPDRTFPVYIDPTYSVTRNGWAMVNRDQPDATFWKWGNGNNGQGVGYNDTEGPVAHKRLFYEFDSGGLGGATIVRADFRAYESWSYSCTKSEIQAWWTSPIFSGTTWNNQPTWHGMLDSQTVANGWRDCNPGGAWLSFDAKNALINTLRNQERYTAIGLRAADEGHNVGWKRFLSNATLSVTYNHPPKVPTGLAMTNPSFPCRTGSSRPVIPAQHLPYLQATPWDDDPTDNLEVNFQVWRMWETRPPVQVATVPASRGHTAVYALQWLDSEPDNTTYRWRARSVDPLGTSDWSPMCEFTLDKHPPNTPTVSLGAGNSYLLGNAISATFGNGGSSDVRQYWWSLNNDATTHGPVSSTSPSVSIPLDHFGPAVLYVRSVDAAGQSNTRLGTVSFVVDWDGHEQDRWALDERIGTSASDQPAGAAGPVGANALTLSGTAGFVPAGAGGGAFYDWGSADDGALQVLGDTGAGSAATSSTGLVDDGDNWTVMGWVQPGPSTVQRVAIGQDGRSSSSLAVSVKQVAVSLPDGTTATRLRFVLTLTNDAGAVIAQVDNPTLVTPGDWYHVAAVRQADPGSVTLVVTDQDDNSQVTVKDVDFDAATVRGRFRLGTGAPTAPASPWSGRIDDVRVFQGSMTADQAAGYAFEGAPA